MLILTANFSPKGLTTASIEAVNKIQYSVSAVILSIANPSLASTSTLTAYADWSLHAELRNSLTAFYSRMSASPLLSNGALPNITTVCQSSNFFSHTRTWSHWLVFFSIALKLLLTKQRSPHPSHQCSDTPRCPPRIVQIQPAEARLQGLLLSDLWCALSHRPTPQWQNQTSMKSWRRLVRKLTVIRPSTHSPVIRGWVFRSHPKSAEEVGRPCKTPMFPIPNVEIAR